MTRLLTHPRFLDHDTGTHPENPDRLRAIERVLAASGVLDHVDRVEATAATRAVVEAVHDPQHVASLEHLSAWGGGRIDADTVASEATFDAAMLAAGAAVEAAKVALDGEPAYALVRPPGHHATATEAMGFCFLNNVAIAARWALDHGGAERVLVFDHDVHHGNGTQDIFYRDPDVCYVSLHQTPLYPGSGWVEEVGEGPGEGFTVNLPLWPGAGETAYRDLLDAVALPVLEAFDPDLLLVSAGFDGHQRDPLANLELGSTFYAEMARDLLERCPRAAFVLEGGYDPTGLGRGVAGQLAVLAGLDVPDWGEAPSPGDPGDAQVKEALEVHGERWGLT